MVSREIEFTALEMEYVCTPKNFLESLRELIAFWILFTMSLNVVKTHISKFQSNNMELLLCTNLYFYKMSNPRLIIFMAQTLGFATC